MVRRGGDFTLTCPRKNVQTGIQESNRARRWTETYVQRVLQGFCSLVGICLRYITEANVRGVTGLLPPHTDWTSLTDPPNTHTFTHIHTVKHWHRSNMQACAFLQYIQAYIHTLIPHTWTHHPPPTHYPSDTQSFPHHSITICHFLPALQPHYFSPDLHPHPPTVSHGHQTQQRWMAGISPSLVLRCTSVCGGMSDGQMEGVADAHTELLLISVGVQHSKFIIRMHT